MITFNKLFKVSGADFTALKYKYCDTCTKCGGTRLISVDDDNYKGDKNCTCVLEFQTAFRAVSSNIPPIYRRLTVDNINEEFSKNNAEGMAKALKYYTRLSKAHLTGVGMFLNGDNGSGKSFIAALILKKALSEGYSAYFTQLGDLTAAAFDALRDEDAREDLETLITQVDFLVVDEFDKIYQDKNDFVINLLEGLFKKRYYSNKPLIVTSNTPFDAIVETHGNGIASMCTEKLIKVSFVGNYRAYQGEKLEDEFFNG